MSYTQTAIEYAQAAIADKKRTSYGKWIRLAAKRYLDDLKRAKQKTCPFFYSEWYVDDVCRFIECLPHVEGRWESPTITLDPAQIFFLAQLFGFRRVDGGVPLADGSIFYPRRYTSAVYCTARKSGKSTLAAGILLYCECCEHEEGAQVISAATTFPQASIIFNVGKRMVEKSQDLREWFGLEVFSKAVARASTGASFKPIHAKASTQDGLNPSHVGMDEIHAHKTPDLLNVLTSAAGARSNPLWLYTTTEGYENPGPWAELRQFSQQLLSGQFGNTADHFLTLLFMVDDEDDDFKESAWVKANPLIRSNPHLLAAIRKEATEAKHMPSKLAEFRIKRLNRRSSSADGWVVLPKWQACGGTFDLAELRSLPCWAALDLSSVRDLCSFRVVWKLPDGRMVTWGRRWVPEFSVHQRTERGTVPYAGWVAAGYLELIPGEVIDHGVIINAVREFAADFNLQACAYDPWNGAQVAGTLLDCGIEMLEFIQGPKSYHPAMSELERLYIAGKLAHGGDPVLNWCAANLIARRDVNLNMAPDKRKAPDKIDDMCALLMAVGISIEPDEEGVAAMIGNTVK